MAPEENAILGLPGPTGNRQARLQSRYPNECRPMTQTMLFLVTVLRALVEVAGFCLLGQGIVGLLAGRRREENFVYRIFQVITRPALRAVRAVLPAVIIDRHIPHITFFVLLWLWLALAMLKRLLAA